VSGLKKNPPEAVRQAVASVGPVDIPFAFPIRVPMACLSPPTSQTSPLQRFVPPSHGPSLPPWTGWPCLLTTAVARLPASPRCRQRCPRYPCWGPPRSSHARPRWLVGRQGLHSPLCTSPPQAQSSPSRSQPCAIRPLLAPSENPLPRGRH